MSAGAAPPPRGLTSTSHAVGTAPTSPSLALHTDLQVVLAVGVVAQSVVQAADPGVRVLTTRSPMRASAVQREEIRRTFEQARRDAYPRGLDPEG